MGLVEACHKIKIAPLIKKNRKIYNDRGGLKILSGINNSSYPRDDHSDAPYNEMFIDSISDLGSQDIEMKDVTLPSVTSTDTDISSWKRKRDFEEGELIEHDTDSENNDLLTDDTLSAQLFLPNHTQYISHQLNLKENSHDVALDLSGVTLPCRDGGNIEEYCMTMLIIFRPWRSPLKLKQKEQTWEEAFNSYTWSDHAITAIKNMHIKYECNDAKNNYNA